MIPTPLPFPWTTELDIWTIQIGDSYGGAIHRCIDYWDVTKSRGCIFHQQNKKGQKRQSFATFGHYRNYPNLVRPLI